MKKISTKLRGNKAHTLESWRFQKGSGKDAKVVDISEQPSYLVTVSGKNEKGKFVSITKKIHSKRVVDSVLNQCGMDKPSYPVESKRHNEDVNFKQKKMTLFGVSKEKPESKFSKIKSKAKSKIRTLKAKMKMRGKKK